MWLIVSYTVQDKLYNDKNLKLKLDLWCILALYLLNYWCR